MKQKIRKKLLLDLAALLICTVHGVGVAGQALTIRPKIQNTTSHYPRKSMDEQDKAFFNIPLNNQDQSACSPPNPGPAWKGITIRAPKKIVLERSQDGVFATIPLCGLYTFELAQLENATPMTIVMVYSKDQKTYSGAVIEQDAAQLVPPPPQPKRDMSLFKGQITSSYFNLNAASYVRLPAQAGVYAVRVDFAGFQSNVVMIDIQ